MESEIGLAVRTRLRYPVFDWVRLRGEAVWKIPEE